MGDIMILMFFKLLKKVIFSSLLIYSFDVLVSSFNYSIPINFFSIFLVSMFDIPALFCLVLFSIVL